MTTAVTQLARLLRVGGGVALLGGAGVFVNSEFLYNVDGGERVVIFDRFRGILPDVSLILFTNFVERGILVSLCSC
jgi:hypothetical protein